MRRSPLRAVPGELPSDDAVLMARVAQGNMGALGEIYDRHAPGLLHFLLRIGPPHEAEDLVQATFLRVVRIAGTFDAEASSARPWLFGIAHRVARERRRSLRRLGAALLDLSGRLRQPSLQSQAARTDLERGLARLSIAKRTVLLLTEAEGFSCQEVATLLGVPVGTVWTRLHHARREMRNFLEGAP